MEAFEQFAALDLEADGFVVSGAIKFPIRRRTRREAYVEYQTHGYEVDLLGARQDALVLATVKSFFGSIGVQAKELTGSGGRTSSYALINDNSLRRQVVKAAARRYGYEESEVHLRLYVGRFAGSKAGRQEIEVRNWCAKQKVGGGPIEVRGATEVARSVMKMAKVKTYRDNSVIVALKVLQEAGLLPDEIVVPNDAII